MNKGWKFLNKLWCWVGEGNKVIWLYQLRWKCKLVTFNSLLWPIYIFHLVDITKLPPSNVAWVRFLPGAICELSFLVGSRLALRVFHRVLRFIMNSRFLSLGVIFDEKFLGGKSAQVLIYCLWKPASIHRVQISYSELIRTWGQWCKQRCSDG